MQPIELVDAADALGDALSGEERIGVDTEFMRETTYFPILCLVQIATERQIFCADPMGEQDLGSFWNALMEPCWVVHSGRQDIEVIFLASGRMPGAIFDTQIAAALLGYAPQLGYGALVSELFGVTLAKTQTRADWSRRPLTVEAMQYAAEDVEYLLPACDLLRERLEQQGRLAWAEEDSRELLTRDLYVVDPQAAVQRIKGARYLRGAQRRAAAKLAAWREQQALRRDRPRQWILKDSVLLELASASPAEQAGLARIPGLPQGTIRRAGAELLAILADARKEAASGVDEDQAPARRDASEKSRLNAMLTLVSTAARELGILPEIVASRKDLTAALHGERRLRVFRGWRRELVGEKLLEMLEG